MRRCTLSHRPLPATTPGELLAAAAAGGYDGGWALTPQAVLWLHPVDGEFQAALPGAATSMAALAALPGAYDITLLQDARQPHLGRQLRWINGYGSVEVTLTGDGAGSHLARPVALAVWNPEPGQYAPLGWRTCGALRTRSFCLPLPPEATSAALTGWEVFRQEPDSGAWGPADHLLTALTVSFAER